MIKVEFILTDGRIMGLEGALGSSVMAVAVDNLVPGISADCGGSLSCGTCHAYLGSEWIGRVPSPRESEVAMLENLVEPRPGSRLTCQLILTPELDGIRLEVPAGAF